MSFARTLQRSLDTDLIDRLESSGRPEERKTLKAKSTPRPSGSYRGARRNEAKKSRNKLKARTVSAATISYAEILKINRMRAARAKHEQQQAA